MTTVTRAVHAANIASKFADNTSRAITPLKQREIATDELDSSAYRVVSAQSPGSAPEAEGDIYVNTTAATAFVAVGASAASDWEQLAFLSNFADAGGAALIGVEDTAGDYTANTVEGILAEIAPQLGGGSGAVSSVNTQTGAVVLDADDIDDSSATNKFTSAGDISKLSGIEAGATADQSAAEIAALSQDWRGQGAETLIAATAALETAASAGISDGDKGDVTVSGSGAVWSVDEAGVTQHEAALSITESQISDLGTYQAEPSEGAFANGDKTKLDGIAASATANPLAVDSDVTGISGADQITNMVSLTEAEHDAITPNISTLYVIAG